MWNDALVVRTDQLQPHLRKFVDNFNVQHPYRVGFEAQQREHMPPGFGGIRWLVTEIVGEDLKTEDMKRRKELHQIDKILAKETEYTRLEVADAILTAMERTDLLHTDIKVIPNPLLRPETVRLRLETVGC